MKVKPSTLSRLTELHDIIRDAILLDSDPWVQWALIRAASAVQRTHREAGCDRAL